MKLGTLTIIAALVVLGAQAAHAQGQAMSAQCNVTEAHATKDKKGIDARLDRYKAQLSQPPYSSWDSWTLLSDQNVTLERQKPTPAKLANGTLTLLYKDKLIEEGGKPRVRVGVEHDDKSGKRVLSTVVVFGGPTIIGGKPYNGGTHFLFLSCSAQ